MKEVNKELPWLLQSLAVAYALMVVILTVSVLTRDSRKVKGKWLSFILVIWLIPIVGPFTV